MDISLNEHSPFVIGTVAQASKPEPFASEITSNSGVNNPPYRESYLLTSPYNTLQFASGVGFTNQSNGRFIEKYTNGLYLENLMCWLDSLISPHGWQDADLIDSSGFIWNRYNPYEERFYPSHDGSGLIGYPTTESGFWQKLRDVWAFVGEKQFVDIPGSSTPHGNYDGLNIWGIPKASGQNKLGLWGLASGSIEFTGIYGQMKNQDNYGEFSQYFPKKFNIGGPVGEEYDSYWDKLYIGRKHTEVYDDDRGGSILSFMSYNLLSGDWSSASPNTPTWNDVYTQFSNSNWEVLSEAQVLFPVSGDGFIRKIGVPCQYMDIGTQQLSSPSGLRQFWNMGQNLVAKYTYVGTETLRSKFGFQGSGELYDMFSILKGFTKRIHSAETISTLSQTQYLGGSYTTSPNGNVIGGPGGLNKNPYSPILTEDSIVYRTRTYTGGFNNGTTITSRFNYRKTPPPTDIWDPWNSSSRIVYGFVNIPSGDDFSFPMPSGFVFDSEHKIANFRNYIASGIINKLSSGDVVELSLESPVYPHLLNSTLWVDSALHSGYTQTSPFTGNTLNQGVYESGTVRTLTHNIETMIDAKSPTDSVFFICNYLDPLDFSLPATLPSNWFDEAPVESGTMPVPACLVYANNVTSDVGDDGSSPNPVIFDYPYRFLLGMGLWPIKNELGVWRTS